jgi:hypothetical protein
MSNSDYRIIVDVKIDNGRSNVSILYPKDQPLLSVKDSSHILASAISLLVKSSQKGEKFKDYEIIKEIIDHLNYEFVDVDSFSDSFVNSKIV